MRMRIDEPGHDDLPRRVDGLARRKLARDGLGRVDPDDVTAIDRDRPRPEHPPTPVHGHNRAAGDDEGDLAPGRLLGGQDRHGHGQKRTQGTKHEQAEFYRS